jgi:enediyne biosynthesis protein E4
LNNGDGTFTDITDEAGVGGDPGWDSVAACVGDFNNDGFLDLYVVNISSSRNALYRNNGDGTFTDVTEESGTADVGDGRTCAWVDFDGDGLIDLFTTNHLNPTGLFRNLGNGKFKDVASQAGIDSPIDIFAAAWGDFDHDGFMDVFLNGHRNLNEPGTALMENSGTPNNFLIIRLIGDGLNTNTSAIGTRVEVSTSSGTQIREVSGGRGCCEQDMLPLHFGVGREKNVDILVKWTSGKECPFSNVDVQGGRMFSISEKGCIINPF